MANAVPDSKVVTLFGLRILCSVTAWLAPISPERWCFWLLSFITGHCQSISDRFFTMQRINKSVEIHRKSAGWNGDVRIAELAAWLVTSQSAPKDGVFWLRFSSQSSSELATEERKKFLRTEKKRGKQRLYEQNCTERSKGEKRKSHSGKKPTTTLHETTRKGRWNSKGTERLQKRRRQYVKNKP